MMLMLLLTVIFMHVLSDYKASSAPSVRPSNAAVKLTYVNAQSYRLHHHVAQSLQRFEWDFQVLVVTGRHLTRGLNERGCLKAAVFFARRTGFVIE